jgi:hypothetical protein
MAGLGLRKWIDLGLGLWLGLGLAHSLGSLVAPLFHNQKFFVLFSQQICRASPPEAD